MRIFVIILGFFTFGRVHAGEIELKEKTDGGEDKSIIIKKGTADIKPPNYEIVMDHDEITGEPDADFKVARQNWQKACNEWKKELKENNKDNKVLTLNCNRPKAEKEGTMTFYSSMAKYRLKVRIRD